MEEGKENWQNIDNTFQWLRRCTHEGEDSVVFCTRLKLHDFSQPPTLTWLSHNSSILSTVTCVLEWLPTHYPEKKLCSRESSGANSCRWSMLYVWLPFQLCIRSNSDSCYGYLSQKLFMTVSGNSFLISRDLHFCHAGWCCWEEAAICVDDLLCIWLCSI